VMLFDRIMEAHTAIRPQVPVTPLDRSPGLSAMLGCDVLLKAEHLQPTGSFKVRGATNKLHALVPLHSSFDRLAPEAVRSGKGCFQAERCSGRGLGKDNSRRSGLGSDQ